MKYNTLLISTSIALTLLTSGCSDSDSTPVTNTETTTLSERFMPMTMNKQIIMQDMNTSLEWVNGREDSSVEHGCFPMGSGFEQTRAQTDANNFCQDLDFASHTDWRLATDMEIQKYTVDMNTSGLTPFYANPACPRVIGKNADGELRTINTHNTNPIGTIKAWESLNAGVRCVRSFETNSSDMNTTQGMM